MSSFARGLYEALITEALEARLAGLDERLVPSREGIRAAEAPDRIALHVGRIVRRAVAHVPEAERAEVGAALARGLCDLVDERIRGAEARPDRPLVPAGVLRALAARRPDGAPEEIPGPLIPLLDTTLLTNAPGEPRVGRQLEAEVRSADAIDVVMAFIRRSGIRPLQEALRLHCASGRPLRVLTTTYTNSTEVEALLALRSLGAEVRVSYDTSSTRLHAKAWLFHRRSGYSTAYIGSSNLTHMAQVSGLEWNVRVSGARNPDVVEKVAAVFESYWSGRDFVPFERAEFLERTRAGEEPGVTLLLPPTELRLEPFQERLLEEIALARQEGRHRNLLVSATGTGKTVMAAEDYARLRASLPRARLLFVAHREEILDQSIRTFRHALRDAGFGERWVGGKRPQRFEHVFASIQSLDANGLAHLPADHFDVVIIDEFHHAAARSYQDLLGRVRPKELLGLTATPERSDGLPILEWFDGRIAAELRLWDAIDRHYLCPFLYFGIHDGTDLSAVTWRRGRGYDVASLSNVLTASDALARRVLEEARRRVDDLDRMRALGFCVSVEHARFMARVARESGLPAVAVWAGTRDEDRRAALADLAARRLSIVFSVDLFNEGVDVPDVDTLLLLRPTESPTLFLQQLGRGLRRAPGKAACTVLDFVGRQHVEFRFDRRLRALLGGSRKDVEAQVVGGFPFLPAGCHMELDAEASAIVLRSIRNALPSQWAKKVEELRSLARGGAEVGLARFLEETGLELEDVYAGKRCWSELRADAGLPVAPSGPHEKALRSALGRLLHVDDRARLEAYLRFLAADEAPDPRALSERERRLLRMLVASVAGEAVSRETTLAEGARLLWEHPQVRAELAELLRALASRIDHVHRPLEGRPHVPLRVHARYTRVEILAACGVGGADRARVAPWQTGVLWAAEERADLLAFTLDKTTGGFSPTTRYRDYAISRDLVHWESQSVTRAASETGRRYQRHAAQGSAVLLFGRLRTDHRAFWFLGPATYVRHEGEQPMAVTWRLEQPLPGDLYASFAAAVA